MARIGLLSDAHGRGAITQRAVRLLIEHGADELVFLGDVCSDSVLEALVEKLNPETFKPDPPVHLVFGNCDNNLSAMSRYATSLGINVMHPTGRLDIDGKTLVFTHGDDYAAMQSALEEGVDYLCHGHTHVVRDERVGRTRVLNPGALFRAAQYTVMMLDTDRDAAEVLTVPA
ncbi:MAG: YfcE family phosphodiesterase [Planctomycetes bacterium]|nr:YfcE family phosphodiesterase [Planctomycetota bacterium]